MQIPIYINILVMLFLVVLIITQLIMYRMRFGKYRYEFFTSRVDFEGKKQKTFLYANYQQAELKQNIFDKMFNTGEIKLSKDFVIGPISNVSQIKNYLEQLIKYFMYTQQRTRMTQQQTATGTTGAQTVRTQQTVQPQQAAQAQQTAQQQQTTQTKQTNPQGGAPQ